VLIAAQFLLDLSPFFFIGTAPFLFTPSLFLFFFFPLLLLIDGPYAIMTTLGPPPPGVASPSTVPSRKIHQPFSFFTLSLRNYQCVFPPLLFMLTSLADGLFLVSYLQEIWHLHDALSSSASLPCAVLHEKHKFNSARISSFSFPLCSPPP